MPYSFFYTEEDSINAKSYYVAPKEYDDIKSLTGLWKKYFNPIDAFYELDNEKIGTHKDYVDNLLSRIGLPEPKNQEELIAILTNTKNRLTMKQIVKLGFLLGFYSLNSKRGKPILDSLPITKKNRLVKLGYKFYLNGDQYLSLRKEYSKKVAIESSGMLVFKGISDRLHLLELLELIGYDTIVNIDRILLSRTPKSFKKASKNFSKMCNSEQDMLETEDFNDNAIQIYSRPQDVGKKGLSECYNRGGLKAWFEKEPDVDEDGNRFPPITEWTENNRSTGYRVYKLPISGSWIDDYSKNLLLTSEGRVFTVKNERRVKIGSQFGVGRLHGSYELVKTLEPVFNYYLKM